MSTPDTARVILVRNSRGQAIRLPRTFAFPDSVTEVDIVREGDALVVRPVRGRWDDFFESPPVSDDFMRERDRGEFEDREPFD